jgi:hypothetical protein
MNRWLKRGVGSLAAAVAVFGIAILAGRGGASSNRQMMPEPVAVTSYAIPHFQQSEPDKKRFGQLEYIGGLELRGAHQGFGGISALRIAPDGARFLAITDTGDWLRGRITYQGATPSGLADVTVAPVLASDGRRAKDVGLWDTESMAVSGGTVFLGIERNHSLLSFDLSQSGLQARGRPVGLPRYATAWPDNRGIEALGIMPQTSAYAGRLIGLAERSHGRDDPTEGFVMKQDGSEPFRFLLKRSDGFDVTDLDFLPNGDLIILERYFTPIRGVAMRLRRIRTQDITPGATVDGEILLTADKAFHVDNMEGLSIHRRTDGEVVFTLISDDNFSMAQRTLLLQFRWLGD